MKKNILIGMLLFQQCVIAGEREGRVETAPVETRDTQTNVDPHRLHQEHQPTKSRVEQSATVKPQGLFARLRDGASSVVTTVTNKISGKTDTSAAKRYETNDDADDLALLRDLGEDKDEPGTGGKLEFNTEEKDEEYFDTAQDLEELLARESEAKTVIDMLESEGGEKLQVLKRKQLEKELGVEDEEFDRLCDQGEISLATFAKNTEALRGITSEYVGNALDGVKSEFPVQTDENKDTEFTREDISAAQKAIKEPSRFTKFKAQWNQGIGKVRVLASKVKSTKLKISIITSPLKGAYWVVRKGLVVVGIKLPIFAITTTLLVSTAIKIDMARAVVAPVVLRFYSLMDRSDLIDDYSPIWATKKAVQGSIALFKLMFLSKAQPKEEYTPKKSDVEKKPYDPNFLLDGSRYDPERAERDPIYRYATR